MIVDDIKQIISLESKPEISRRVAECLGIKADVAYDDQLKHLRFHINPSKSGKPMPQTSLAYSIILEVNGSETEIENYMFNINDGLPTSCYFEINPVSLDAKIGHLILRPAPELAAQTLNMNSILADPIEYQIDMPAPQEVTPDQWHSLKLTLLD